MKKLAFWTLLLIASSCTVVDDSGDFDDRVEATEDDGEKEGDSDHLEGCDEKSILRITMPEGQTEPTIEKGVYGKVLEWKGDFMPGPEPPTGTVTPLETELFIFKKLTFDAAKSARAEEFSMFWNIEDLEPCPIAVISTNEEGFFELELEPGTYSGMIKANDTQLYINLFGGDEGILGPIYLEEGKLHEQNFDLDFEKSI